MREIESVLCDMDGTLIDSEDVHSESWDALLARHGCSAPPGWHDDCIGIPDQYALDKAVSLCPELAGLDGLMAEKEECFRELVVRKGARLPYPGVRELIAELRDAGVKLAVGTNSILRNTRVSLEAAGLIDFFPVIVTLDQVARGKPHPDIYLAAAERLGTAPGRCVVVEDSAAGVDAAKAAGCLVYAVANTLPRERLTGADKVYDTSSEAFSDVVGIVSRTALNRNG